MRRALVVSSTRKPLMPCHPARARELMRAGRAAVLKWEPFTIILEKRDNGNTQPLAPKLDPGSKTTGVALVADCMRGRKVVWSMEIVHRGQEIGDSLASRRGLRRSRRSRKTRYRESRFLNRSRPKGWLALSLRSRVENVMSWVGKLGRAAPLSGISVELVRFDTQAIQNPEVAGIEYQQGTLYGYEVKEYLLEKWGRSCAYCKAHGVPLEIEHIVACCKGGSDRVSNLTLACRKCNQKKGTFAIGEFLRDKPEVLTKILAQAKSPLRDASAVNSTRWALFEEIKAMGLSVEVGTGGRTKYNRRQQGYPKAHWIDAACVGASGEKVHILGEPRPLLVKAKGHGSRQLCGTDAYGFPIRHRSGTKEVCGFHTGDIVMARIPRGKYKGKHKGAVAVRARGYFDLKGIDGKRIAHGISHKYMTVVHHFDGYNYDRRGAFLPALNYRASCASLS